MVCPLKLIVTYCSLLFVSLLYIIVKELVSLKLYQLDGLFKYLNPNGFNTWEYGETIPIGGLTEIG